MIWLRANDGVFFGVCKGLAKVFHVPVGLLRLIWIAAVLCGGFGIGVYLLFAIALPREDQYWRAYDRRVLGVCSKLARRNQIDVGLVRFFFLCSIFVSLGITVIAYFVLHFLLEENTDKQRPTAP